MKQLNFLFLLLFLGSSCLQAQRYLTPVFNEVTVTPNVTYGVNATVLLLSQAGQAVPQPLTVDIYEPAGDTANSRPLIVLLHTGNFLPPQVNGGCSGTNKDADIVNLATRLAKLGYVVGAANYRLGWNPVAPSQTERVFTLINAAYRGVQDSRTAIRFFRKTAAQGNPYSIDSTKVVLWGVGTGGYVSFASATLDRIEDTYVPGKFVTAAGPMVIEPVNGNLDGTQVGITFPGYPGFPAGDTLNYPNHLGYSSEFNLGVNMGGALGDSSWIDANDPPFISYHVPTDPFAPCDVGIVLVPVVNLPVVEVSGSCSAQPIMNRFNNNDCFASANLSDPISQIARQRSGGVEGLFLFPTSDPTEGGQWSYASSTAPYGVMGASFPCDTNSVSSNRYLDTIVQYFAPRAFICLNLTTSSVTPLVSKAEAGLKMMPNPASSQVLFQTNLDYPMQDVQLFDLNGRLLRSYNNVRNNTFYLDRGQLPPGVYVARIRLEKGILAERLIFR